MADFSDLPDVTWVRVLSFLGLQERAQVANTCHRLNDVFRHPSLWYSVNIQLLGNLDKYRQGTFIWPKRYIEMVRQFGGFFQDLTLVLLGYTSSIPQECQDVITALGKNCRLKSLTLEVFSLVTKQELSHAVPHKLDQLNSILSLVTNAFRLQKFAVKTWPMYKHKRGPDILEALCSNPKLENLEELNLFWESAERQTWSTRNAMLPGPGKVCSTVAHFKNLSSLLLQSPMLSDDLLLVLSKSFHRPLTRLGILLTYNSSDPTSRGGIPRITNSCWKQLHTHAPEIQVDVTIVTRVPFMDLTGFLKIDIPLTSLNFMRYARCGSLDIQSITDKYHLTLRKFVSFSDDGDFDEDLLAMISKCEKLNVFKFHGAIHSSTVVRLAEVRNRQWYQFVVNIDNMATYEKGNSETDDNMIIGIDDGGRCAVVKSAAAAEREADRDTRLEAVHQTVSRHLGRTWMPVTTRNVNAWIASQSAATSYVVPQKLVTSLNM